MIRENEIILIEKYFANSLSANEQLEFEKLLLTDTNFKAEFEEQSKIKEVLNQMKLKNPEKEIWDKYWLSTFNLLERRTAWLFVLIPSLILTVYVIINIIDAFVQDSSIQPFIKYTLAFLIFGILLLTYSLIREKLTVNSKDKFKEIQR